MPELIRMEGKERKMDSYLLSKEKHLKVDMKRSFQKVPL